MKGIIVRKFRIILFIFSNSLRIFSFVTRFYHLVFKNSLGAITFMIFYLLVQLISILLFRLIYFFQFPNYKLFRFIWNFYLEGKKLIKLLSLLIIFFFFLPKLDFFQTLIDEFYFQAFQYFWRYYLHIFSPNTESISPSSIITSLIAWLTYPHFHLWVQIYQSKINFFHLHDFSSDS